MRVRNLHRILGIVLLLPFFGWAITGLVFFIKPGYAGAYEILNPRTYPLNESISISLDPGQKQEPGLQGSYEKELVGIEASVKDSARFKEQWAYFNFIGPDRQPLAKARAFAKEACWSCHDVNAQTDHVFTQFYPVLREFAPKK